MSESRQLPAGLREEARLNFAGQDLSGKDRCHPFSTGSAKCASLDYCDRGKCMQHVEEQHLTAFLTVQRSTKRPLQQLIHKIYVGRGFKRVLGSIYIPELQQ